MKDHEQDTPPSSVNGDEISAMNEEIIYLGELDDLMFDDDMDDPMEPPVEIVEQSLLLFKMHKGSVFSCDIHPSGTVAVTGAEDDKAFVWSVETGEVVMNCVGHKDSVVFVGFSFDGVYLATVDMSGLIKVWKCNLENSEPWPIVFEYETDDFTWGMWHFGARVLVCGASSGNIFVFKIPSGETKVLQGHNEVVECGKIFPNGTKLAAGYEDGSIKVWDIKDKKVLHHIEAGHRMKVTALDVSPENNLIASVSNDGRILLITPLNGKIVAQWEADIELETISFFKDGDQSLLALCCLTGSITIWDVARRMMRLRCSSAEESCYAGVTKSIWVDNILVTGCLDGAIRAYDPKVGSAVMQLTGHRSEILDICYNKQKNLLLTTSDDGTARIFKYEIDKDKD